MAKTQDKAAAAPVVEPAPSAAALEIEATLREVEDLPRMRQILHSATADERILTLELEPLAELLVERRGVLEAALEALAMVSVADVEAQAHKAAPDELALPYATFGDVPAPHKREALADGDRLLIVQCHQLLGGLAQGDIVINAEPLCEVLMHGVPTVEQARAALERGQARLNLVWSTTPHKVL